MAGKTAIVLALLFSWTPAAASCGAASCFIAHAEETAVQRPDGLTLELEYQYSSQSTVLGGSDRIAGVRLEKKQIVEREHRERSSINHQIQARVQYDVSRRWAVQVSVPVVFRTHDHWIEVGDEHANEGAGMPERFRFNRIGDIRLQGSYALLTSSRDRAKIGIGLELPTGKTDLKNREGEIQEATLQPGRGAVGILASVFQSHALQPGRLSQFASLSYRHTFENSAGYRFGGEFMAHVGLRHALLSRLSVSGQFNLRHAFPDSFPAVLLRARDPANPGEPEVLDENLRRRNIPNTGSTALAFSPGVTVDFAPGVSLNLHAQIPLIRNFNGNLGQGVNFLGGVAYRFSVR